MRTQLVPMGHARREQVEAFIAVTFEVAYAARIECFAPTLVALFDGMEIQCAAGIRFSGDGFFSECYLDHPVEISLLQTGQRPIARNRILEIASLCSRSPSHVPLFIRQLIRIGDVAELDCAIFTATRRLRQLLERIDIPILQLADADPLRIKNVDAWGTYYQTDPKVYALTRQSVETRRAATGREVSQHA